MTSTHRSSRARGETEPSRRRGTCAVKDRDCCMPCLPFGTERYGPRSMCQAVRRQRRPSRGFEARSRKRSHRARPRIVQATGKAPKSRCFYTLNDAWQHLREPCSPLGSNIGRGAARRSPGSQEFPKRRGRVRRTEARRRLRGSTPDRKHGMLAAVGTPNGCRRCPGKRPAVPPSRRANTGGG